MTKILFLLMALIIIAKVCCAQNFIRIRHIGLENVPVQAIIICDDQEVFESSEDEIRFHLNKVCKLPKKDFIYCVNFLCMRLSKQDKDTSTRLHKGIKFGFVGEIHFNGIVSELYLTSIPESKEFFLSFISELEKRAIEPELINALQYDLKLTTGSIL